MFKAYPRHSVDISSKEYKKILTLLFSYKMFSGDYTSQFELMFSDYINTHFSISMPSARLGLYALLKYFNFPEGSEAIITPFTHWSIFTVIKSCRLKPIFVDIDEHTYNIHPSLVKKHITRNTKLLILTHMWGQPCEMDVFVELKREFNIKIIEDCAMACGSNYNNKKVGSFGEASIFSFGKAKALSTFGGGMLCTDNVDIYEYIREFSADFHYEKPSSLTIAMLNSILANILTRPHIFYFSMYPILRLFNMRDPYNPIEHKKDTSIILDEIPHSWKVKLSNIQAAVGIEQLKRLDECNQKRIENARILNNILSHIKDIGVPLAIPKAKHIYLYYAVLIKKKINIDTLREKLIALGVDSQLHELTTPRELKLFGFDSSDYPVFDNVSQNLLIIPNGIYLAAKDALYISNAFKRIVETFN